MRLQVSMIVAGVLGGAGAVWIDGLLGFPVPAPVAALGGGAICAAVLWRLHEIEGRP